MPQKIYNENVLVIPRQALLDNAGMFFHGVSLDPYYLHRVFDSSIEPFYLDRNLAETDPEFKQIIPYVMVRVIENNTVVLFTRQTDGGESRLHGKTFFGVGGHLNDTDSDVNPDMHGRVQGTIQAYHKGLRREVFEELGISIRSGEEPRVIGALNLESSDVDKCHLGIFHLLNLKLSEVEPILRNEFPGDLKGKVLGAVPPVHIYLERMNLEGWSNYALYGLQMWMRDKENKG